uniref:Ankyrin repeat domain-containing protein n=1 Tax=Neogobius melanostomus TaxID=47308 RepID=A0A8C6WZB2_9GOBI
MTEHVDMEGWTGRTALRAAAWGGHEEIVHTLLEYGASVDRADGNGRTPLIAAAYMGHQETDVVELLLEAGADVDETAGPDGEVQFKELGWLL